MAYADSSSSSSTGGDELRHGTVSISSDNATDDVINLKVGESATITVAPYIHKQYKGCGKTECPESCEEAHGVECFVQGMGCKCDHEAVDRTAKVSTKIADAGIVSASDVVAATQWSNTNTDLKQDGDKYVTKNGTITLTAAKAGTTTVTVTAETDEDGSVNGNSGNTSTLLEYWHPATKTYTVNVEADGVAKDESGAYLISSESDLKWFADKVNAGEYGLSAKLTTNIELSDGVLPSICTEQDESKAFTGTIDGQGFTISGITSFSNLSAPAFISNLGTGTIKNLTLAGTGSSAQVSLNTYGGAAFVFNAFAGTIENCVNEINLQVTKGAAAGILYRQPYKSAGSVKIVSCVNKGSIKSSVNSGTAAGIAAIATYGASLEILQCENDGSVTTSGSSSVASGIVGKASGNALTVRECVNKGEVSTTASSAACGGIIGKIEGGTGSASVESCYNAGGVKATSSTSAVGGLAGQVLTSANSSQFSNCFNVGTVTTAQPAQAKAGAAFGYVDKTGDGANSASNVFYQTSDLPAAGTVNKVEGTLATAKTADEIASADFTTSLGSSFKMGYQSGHPILTWEPNEQAPIKIADQKIKLRQSGDSSKVSISLENADDAWASAVTSVKVTPVKGDTRGTTVEVPADRYSVNGQGGKITVTRNDANPVFVINVDDEFNAGEISIASRWGATTYPNSKQYEVVISADGYDDAVGTVTFYTGTNKTFRIVLDADGDVNTTDDQTVKGEWTEDQLKAMEGFGFYNGSSQCGMTGFRTFSGYGVSLETLMAAAGVEPSEKDSYLIDTSDHYGNSQTYQSLFGVDRYFLASIYTDQDVKDAYAKLVESDDEAGSTIELRKLLASKALSEQTTVKPMISTGYSESMLSKDQVASAVLPTADNTSISAITSLENKYRFIYGIKLAKEDCTVTFNTNGGSEVASQTVQSNLMTSEENTTWSSSYWVSTLYVLAGAGTETKADTNPEQLTVPENPEKEGFVFDGWYTKDGTESGDWGSRFDFTANNGTVDSDTQLYAKWIDPSNTAEQTGHSASAWREAQYGEPPAGDSSNEGQHATVRISFDGPVSITDADALRSSLNLSITGSAGSYTLTADGNDLVIDTTLGFALMYGAASVSAVSDSGYLSGITAGGKQVKIDPIDTLVDTGLAFEPTLVVAGTDSTPASTTFKVTHGANVRSMNHVAWLTNAGQDGTGVSILSNTGDASQSTTAHHHMWYKFTAIDSASSICGNAAEALEASGYDITDNGDGTFTLTAKKAKAGEILSAAPYTDSFFNDNKLALGQDISGVAMPEPTSNVVDLGMKVDMGDDGYETMSTNMGKNPAGKVGFSLVASDEALTEYQKSHVGATLQSMLQDWVNGITSVTVGGKKLEGKAFDEWKASLNDPNASADTLAVYDLTSNAKKATLTLPVALFDTSVSEQATLPLVISSEGFVDVTDKVTYRNIGSTAVVVRILSEDGSEVQQVRTLTLDQLKNLTVQEHYNTAANCGMAGLRAFSSEGVLLSDVLAAAGVEFSQGMSLKMRVNDYLDANGDASTTETGYTSDTYTYESLMGTDRYYYPAMWDDTTTYSELGGKTIYQVLSEDRDAWKGSSEQAQFLAKKLGETKQQVQPILAWSWNEGVVGWGGSNPADSDTYNKFTSDESFRLLYGLKANEDGSAADDNTTFSNVYAVFGIDVIGGKSVPTPEPAGKADMSKLNELIDAASQLNQADYTAESWAAYAAALESAKAVAAKAGTATQAEVDAAAKALSDAQAALVKADGQAGKQPTDKNNQQASASGNGKTLATTGDSVLVFPIVCIAAGALLLVSVAVVRRRSVATQMGAHGRRH